MTEADRIRALRDEGRIDDVQARRLLNALGIPDDDSDLHEPVDTASVEGTVADTVPANAATEGRPPEAAQPGAAASDASASDPSRSDTDPTDSTPSGSAFGFARSDANTPPSATDHVPDVRHWARIELFACELDVVVDASLDAPIAESKDGDVGVETTEGGWRIAQGDRAEGSWLERLIDGVHQGRVKLRLPEGTGVHLDVKAGDVDLDGVPALRGRLMAGDLDARGLRAVDVAVSAGDVDLEIDPAVGAHRVRLSVGDLSIRLPAHADVEVEGHVSIGDASASAPFATKRTGMVAQLVQGTMGQGRATLRADVGTGDLTVGSDRDGL